LELGNFFAQIPEKPLLHQSRALQNQELVNASAIADNSDPFAFFDEVKVNSADSKSKEASQDNSAQ